MEKMEGLDICAEMQFYIAYTANKRYLQEVLRKGKKDGFCLGSANEIQANLIISTNQKIEANIVEYFISPKLKYKTPENIKASLKSWERAWGKHVFTINLTLTEINNLSEESNKKIVKKHAPKSLDWKVVDKSPVVEPQMGM